MSLLSHADGEVKIEVPCPQTTTTIKPEMKKRLERHLWFCGCCYLVTASKHIFISLGNYESGKGPKDMKICLENMGTRDEKERPKMMNDD